METKEKKAFEPSGLVPRSIVRTFERFRQQLLPGSETAAIREYRISRYQVLVSARCLFTLLTIPIMTNWLVSSWLLAPLIEHFWNTQQNEIFLNSYQEERAFAELEFFSEKLFFESLLDKEDLSYGLYSTTSSSFSLANPKILQPSCDENEFLIPPRSPKIMPHLFPGQQTFAKHHLPANNLLISAPLPASINTPASQTKSGPDTRIKKPKDISTGLPTGILSPKDHLQLTTSLGIPKAGDLSIPNRSCVSECPLATLPPLAGEGLSALTPISPEVIMLSPKGMQIWETDSPSYHHSWYAVSSLPRTLNTQKACKAEYAGNPNPYPIAMGINCLKASTLASIPTIAEYPYLQGKGLPPYASLDNPQAYHQRCSEAECLHYPTGIGTGGSLPYLWYPKGEKMGVEAINAAVASMMVGSKGDTEKPAYTSKALLGELSALPEEALLIPFTNTSIKIREKVQEKILELAIYYNQQTILSITNIMGDLVSVFTLGCLFVWMRPEIAILKSFLIEAIYSLSDTTKSFLLILLTDLLVGFHSPRGWETALELLLKHFGLPENQDFVFLFVATFPVLLDTVFKYWIFRHLNKISPSTVATYHSMIE